MFVKVVTNETKDLSAFVILHNKRSFQDKLLHGEY